MDRLEEFKKKGVDPQIVQIILLDEICGRLEELCDKIDKMNILLARVMDEKLD